MTMKIVTIVGARPQFIKAAAVSRAVAEHNLLLTASDQPIDEVIVHTGQHYDPNMSDIFFEEMRIPRPAHCLDINDLSHGAMTGRMLEAIEAVLLREDPCLVVVYGDTNSTVAGALAGAKLGIPVAHIEAGLRSFNRRMPEEINRVLTDHLSTLLICPTRVAIANLNAEGIRAESPDIPMLDSPDDLAGIFQHPSATTPGVCLVGDVMYDAVRFYGKHLSPESTVLQRLDLASLDRARASNNPTFALCTIHRAETTDDPARLRAVLSALDRIAKELPVVFPVHPRTQKRLRDMSLKPAEKGVRLIDPVSYLDMLQLLRTCSLVMTDSGGLQKEAFFFRKPCLTLREETEWTELVEHGCNRLTGTDAERIWQAYLAMREHSIDPALSFYGKGHASEVIVALLYRIGLLT